MVTRANAEQVQDTHKDQVQQPPKKQAPQHPRKLHLDGVGLPPVPADFKIKQPHYSIVQPHPKVKVQQPPKVKVQEPPKVTVRPPPKVQIQQPPKVKVQAPPKKQVQVTVPKPTTTKPWGWKDLAPQAIVFGESHPGKGNFACYDLQKGTWSYFGAAKLAGVTATPIGGGKAGVSKVITTSETGVTEVGLGYTCKWNIKLPKSNIYIGDVLFFANIRQNFVGLRESDFQDPSIVKSLVDRLENRTYSVNFGLAYSVSDAAVILSTKSQGPIAAWIGRKGAEHVDADMWLGGAYRATMTFGKDMTPKSVNYNGHEYQFPDFIKMIKETMSQDKLEKSRDVIKTTGNSPESNGTIDANKNATSDANLNKVHPAVKQQVPHSNADQELWGLPRKASPMLPVHNFESNFERVKTAKGTYINVTMDPFTHQPVLSSKGHEIYRCPAGTSMKAATDFVKMPNSLVKDKGEPAQPSDQLYKIAPQQEIPHQKRM
jgi:hypothetical protein